MTAEEKKLIELIEFHVNDKANHAAKMEADIIQQEKAEFWQGQYQAFNEIYSLLQNIKRTI